MTLRSSPSGQLERLEEPLQKGPKRSLRPRFIDEKGRLLGKVNWLDALTIGSALLLIPMFFFAYRVVAGSFELEIKSVTPARFVTGVDETLTIIGTGFDPYSTVQFGTFPSVKGVFVNEVRLDVKVPAELPPGRYAISVLNGHGRLIGQEAAFELIWKPRIDAVSMEWTTDEKTLIHILGAYFEKGCTVSCEQLPVPSLPEVSSSFLMGVIPFLVPPGEYLVSVKNANGLSSVQACRLTLESVQQSEIVPRKPAPVEDAESYWKPTIHQVIPTNVKADESTRLIVLGDSFAGQCRVVLGGVPLKEIKVVNSSCLVLSVPAYTLFPGRFPLVVQNPNGSWAEASIEVIGQPKTYDDSVVVVMRFEKLSRQELSLLANPVKPDPADGTAFGKVIAVLDRARRSVLAEVLLGGYTELLKEGRRFIYRGEEVSLGKKLLVRLPPGNSVNGVVVSRPLHLRRPFKNSEWDLEE